MKPMVIERRHPKNLYRRRAEWRLRDCIPLKAVAKYAALTLIGFLLFRAGQAHALAERGYEALGGEVFALFLPVLYWMVTRVLRDTLDARKGNGHKSMKIQSGENGKGRGNGSGTYSHHAAAGGGKAQRVLLR